MAGEVRQGLEAALPTLPCKYFYDDRGSRLFEEITRLPEYYLTRAEEAILEAVADEVIGEARPRELVELGSGAGRKVRVLLDAMARAGSLERCLLLDINETFLNRAVAALAAAYPELEVGGVRGDFVRDLGALGSREGRMVAFLASTIGNLHPAEVAPFFRRVAAVLTDGGAMLLGVDLVKDRARLEAAYNDAAGVTALFNRNILRVVNERLGGDFDLDGFEHVAFYDERNAWIEMRLRARRPMTVRIAACGLTLRLRRGDEIRTELSCKYTRESLEARLRSTGLRLRRWFTDGEDLFALALLERTGEPVGSSDGARTDRSDRTERIIEDEVARAYAWSPWAGRISRKRSAHVTKGLLERLKSRGEEVLGQLSAELMSNPHFMKAMEGAMRGKQKLDRAVGQALKTMNVPTRTEFKKALGRIEALEKELAALKARAGKKRSARPRRRSPAPGPEAPPAASAE
jgi:L-histidine N-alpha-methyltransferase